MTLREAIVEVLGARSLTYSEIVRAINKLRLYVPHDGMLVPETHVRATIRENPKYSCIDRNTRPYRVSVRPQP